MSGVTSKSPLLAQLESVDLSSGTLHRAGARALLRNAAAFEHLKSIDLSANILPDELCDQLVRTFGPIVKLGGHFSTPSGE